MENKELVKIVEEIKSKLGLRKRYTLADLVRYVQKERGRPISIKKVMDLPIQYTGMWVKGISKDYILCPEQSTQAHIEHIVLHELAHMLLGHRPAIFLTTAAEVESFVSQTHPQAVAEFARSVYSRPEEIEAESLATSLSSGMDVSDTKSFWEDLRKQDTVSDDNSVLIQLDDLLKGI